MTSSSSLSQVQCQGKHAIHFSLDLKLNCKVKASNIHGVRLATDNTILVRHRLYTPDSQIGNISAFYRQRFGKSSAYSALLLQPFRTIGKHSGANSGTVGILPRRIRLLRIGFSVYTATFRMPLCENMPNEPDSKAPPIY